ncbi:hypothetical protein F5Y15DRAFT_332468 [Xylariaceae sp. FL0016]|nr:hypothetical protein F5Y15DRAFT_332468 [Xylariaceae sp. FL0016]
MPRRSSDTCSACGQSLPNKAAKKCATEKPPTEAQLKKQKAEETTRKMKERQERDRERPMHPNDARMVLAVTQIPRKRHGGAYDDKPNKKPKIVTKRNGTVTHQKVSEKLAWGYHPELEQRASLCNNGSSIADLDQDDGNGIDPVMSMGVLGKIPAEIRDDIFRYLLLTPNDIPVLRCWSVVKPRKKPSCHLGILSTCKVFQHQGLRILYGENTFKYALRNPSDAHVDTQKFMAISYKGCHIPIDQYSHLLRHIKIRIEKQSLDYTQNCEAFEQAICKFLPEHGLAPPANIHTLTIEVPAMTQRTLQWTGFGDDMNRVPVASILKRACAALLQLQAQYIRVIATDREDKLWETLIDLRYYAKEKLMQGQLDGAGDLDSGKDSIPHDAPPMIERWERSVSRAKSALRNLPWRVEGLALDPDKAINKMGLWTYVSSCDHDDGGDNADRGGQRSGSRRFVGETMSLPPNYRDTPLRTRTDQKAAGASAAKDKGKGKGKTSFPMAIRGKGKQKSKIKDKSLLTQKRLESVMDERSDDGEYEGDDDQDSEEDDDDESLFVS